MSALQTTTITKNDSFFFCLLQAACGTLVPQPGIEPRPSAAKAQSPNHWITREFPESLSSKVARETFIYQMKTNKGEYGFEE